MSRLVAAALCGTLIAAPQMALAESAVASLAVPHAAAVPSLRDSAGWAGAVTTRIDWDFTHGKPAEDPTDVALAVDGTALFVRFTAHQHDAITATQSVDDVGDNTDDDVTVRLWPGGRDGFEYTFRANPKGTHYQYSTENANYAPSWSSVGAMTADGYVVTMRIPLGAIRGDGRATWLAQFERDVRVRSERDVWSHAPGMASSDQVVYAGSLGGFADVARAARTKPRVGFYSLAEAGPARTGGSTARNGADIAIPVTSTASFVATIHPDFSNVETDQASISPTTFTRYYNEVRPFFAQGSNFYDWSSCYGCAGWSELYTPAIPTPKRGYQLEGKQGPFSIGLLDAVGDARSDNAESLAWTGPGKHDTFNYTRVASEQPGTHDVTDFASFLYNSQHGVIGYLEGGTERGNLVGDARKARRWDAGIAYSTKDDFDSFTMRSVGPSWNPVDGYTAVNDIGGYSAQVNRTFHPNLRNVQSFALWGYWDRYAATDGLGTNLYDFNYGGNVYLKNKFSAAWSLGSSFYRVSGDPTLHPSNQEGGRIDYRRNTPLQSTFSYNRGRFGDGMLVSTDAIAGFRVLRKLTLSFEDYGTNWRGDGGGHNLQWLERGSVNVDLGPKTTMTFGVRKVIGTAPPFPGQSAPSLRNATNLSFGFSTRRQHDDFYLVYGDASVARTRPAMTLKYVHYFGAEKGT